MNPIDIMAPAMFAALVVFLLLGLPVAFSLAALGLASGFVAIEAGLFPPQFMANLPYRVFGILSNELLLSNTQDQLINSLINRLTATVNVNITYAQLLRELLPVYQVPNRAISPTLQLGSKSAAY